MQHVREKLEEIICRVQPFAKEKGITDDSNLIEDLRFDSYDRMETIIIAEVELGFEIDEERDLKDVKTFGQLLAVVEQKIRKRNAT